MQKINIGQYYAENSIIHMLDPRVKIFFILLYLIELFVFTNLVSYIIFTIILFVIIILSKVPIKNVVGSIGFLIFIVFISSFNLFWIEGNKVLQVGNVTITDKGIKTTTFISIRLIYILMSSSLLILTTTSERICEGIAGILKPLKKFIPVNEMAMITSIMLRFIPVLFEEATKIKKAQISRGVNFETKKITQRVKNYFPLFIPLFVSSFRRSNELAVAIISRGYNGNYPKTKLRPLQYNRKDYIAYSFIMFNLILLICIKIL